MTITKCCQIDFTIEETSLNFCIENTSLEFNADLGYLKSDVSDYSLLTNKPQINYHTLQAGNNTYEYLGVEPTIIDITEQDIDNIIFGG